MRPWAESIKRLGLSGIVFHDTLSNEFTSAFESDHLEFIQVPAPDLLSANDYRFLIWRDWLSANPVESVFFTDLFDVVVNRNPFELFKDNHQLLISHQGNAIGETPYFIRNYERVYGNLPDDLKGGPELNAGVWGGPYTEALRFLNLISMEIEKLARGQVRSFNVNMPAFNFVAYNYFGRDNIWANGSPLHSEFRKYQYDANVAFVHK